ncbi:MAG: Yae1 family protein [Planctomycetota bacterium]
MYDSREKAIRDQESHLIESLSKGRKQGLRKGLKRGLEKGLKQGREQGREEGREEGARIGIEVGFIQSLQEILGIEVQSQQELTQKSLPELIALKESLQAVVRDKNR